MTNRLTNHVGKYGPQSAISLDAANEFASDRLSVSGDTLNLYPPRGRRQRRWP